MTLTGQLLVVFVKFWLRGSELSSSGAWGTLGCGLCCQGFEEPPGMQAISLRRSFQSASWRLEAYPLAGKSTWCSGWMDKRTLG